MMYIFSLVLLHVLGCSAGGGGCHGNDCINTAIDHVDISYDEHLCKEIQKLHCDHLDHHMHDVHQPVCGKDGVTYPTHCLFAQARCFWILDHNNNHHHQQLIVLDVQNYGPCITSTTSAPTNASVITSATLAAIGGQTSQQIGGQTTQQSVGQTTQQSGGQTTQQSVGQTAQQSGGQTTQQIGAFTTQKQTKPTTIQQTTVVTTTTLSTTTATMSVLELMQKVFCDNKGIIDCSTSFDVQCGSDGMFYPNPCEMTKAACDNPTLQAMPLTSCSI